MKLPTLLIALLFTLQALSLVEDASTISLPLPQSIQLTEPQSVKNVTTPSLKLSLIVPKSCPTWNPIPTLNSTASNFPKLILQNIITRDGICEKALSQDCAQYTKVLRGDKVFAFTLKRNLDFTYYGGRIIAYRIKWFSGSWSKWFVPGVNDIGPKYWTVGGVKHLMRWWAYFSDHTHTFILCK